MSRINRDNVMKDKIKAALQQGHKNLGLGEEVFERVASAAETFITDEAMIPKFVEGAKPMLQMIQGNADRVRTEMAARVKELEEKLKGKPDAETKGGKDAEDEKKKASGSEKDGQEKTGAEKPDVKEGESLAEIVARAVSAAVTPLQERLQQMEASTAQEKAVAEALGRIDAWDYAGKYPKERAKAQAQAMELYEAYGKKWDADTLEAKIRDKFKAEVAELGVDTNKPLESDGKADGKMPDFSKHIEMLRKAGVELPEAGNEGK